MHSDTLKDIIKGWGDPLGKFVPSFDILKTPFLKPPSKHGCRIDGSKKKRLKNCFLLVDF